MSEKKVIKAPQSFTEKAKAKTGKSVQAGDVAVASKPAKASSQQPTKVAKQVVRRRPNLISWSQLGIKVGQELTFKDNSEIRAIVQSEVTMELEVTIPGEPPFRTPGVMVAEKKVREHLNKPKKNPQGWDFWGFTEKDDQGKEKWKSVYALYTSVYVLA